MTQPSVHFSGYFPAFAAADLHKLAGPLPTWAYSTESSWQQWGLAEGIVRGARGDQVLLSAAAGLLAWSWQQRPLHAAGVSLLVALDAQLRFLSDANKAYVLGLKKRLRPMPPNERWEAVKADGDQALIKNFLETALKGPLAASWLGEAWEQVAALEDRDFAAALIAQAAGDPLVAARLCAELAYIHTGTIPEDFSHTPFAPWSRYMAGHAARQRQDFQAAAAHWLPLLGAIPWNANLTLLAHDAALLPAPGALPAAKTAILAYCWNKAELIAQTLESLFASGIGDNPVFVLDNGSTDATPQTLAAAQDRFGRDRLTIVTLPINVGAPGARNWLLSLPEVRACRFAAFLDDDVILPADWLARLLQAALRHPGCGTVGAAIRDHAHPHKLQSADYHLLHRLPGEAGEEPGERLRVFNNCTGTLDFGLFAYERPCLSVSGCCHVLDLSLLESVGVFDVRFTPTQFDDLDRDIRSFLAGRPCLFAGHAVIGHVQRSSLRQASSPAQVAHIVGNKIKLEAKYGDADIDALVRANLEMVWKDLLEKQAALARL